MITGRMAPFSRGLEVRRDHRQPWTLAQRVMAGKVRQ
jgi:hypothetical protein